MTGSISGLDDNEWHFVVVTYDGSSLASGVNFYVDGVKDIAITIDDDTLSASILNNDPITIASREGGGIFFTGQIDNVAIWDFELTESADTAGYNEGLGVQVLV